MEVAYVSLNTTQKDIQESKLKIYQIQKELDVSHLSSCMQRNALGMMEELHAEDEHEESSYLHVLEEFEAKQDEDHAPVYLQRYCELLLGGFCTILEEVHDHTLVESISSLMDEYCIELVCSYSPHTSISATSCGDEN